MEQLLALFPLNTVLFPRCMLPLHIFEPRYKQMINRCLRLGQPFGVVLIREGVEVEGPAEPYTVGTTAVIQNALKFEDGRMLLAAVGEQRFRIRQIIQDDPYLVAAVEYLADEVTPDAIIAAASVRELYARHLQALAHATGTAPEVEELPEDPLELSYRLSDLLHIVYQSKQQLLEADLEERLEAIAEALENELRFLPESGGTPPPSTDRRWSLN